MSAPNIRIMCPSLVCRKVLAVPSTARGKNVKCRACGTIIRIPEKPRARADEAAAPQPAPGQPQAQNQPKPKKAA